MGITLSTDRWKTGGGLGKSVCKEKSSARAPGTQGRPLVFGGRYILSREQEEKEGDVVGENDLKPMITRA